MSMMVLLNKNLLNKKFKQTCTRAAIGGGRELVLTFFFRNYVQKPSVFADDEDDDELLNILQNNVESDLADSGEEYDLATTGFVSTLGDGIAKIEGLYEVGLGELLSFESGETGMVLGIETNFVSAVVFGNYENIKQNDAVFALGLDVGIEAGTHLLGKVINALGESLDPENPVIAPDEDDEDDEENLLVQ
jgi:F0F1-type ATP synthase alpha subunit